MKTLISRRAAHLPDESKELLADAAVLGRHFSLKDLREVELRVNDGALQPEPAALALALAPAVTAGLLAEHAEQAAADYSFQHEQVRDFAAGTLTQARRQAIHAAIVELLLSGEPSPESLPLLAYHAKAAGDAAVCVRFSVEASRNALAANAPEEVLRVVELALPSAATSQERLDLLEARDRALDMLRRPSDRLEGLAELSALAEALGDSHLELDVRLRRAAALRTAEEYDRAAQLAREVRELAVERQDRSAELAACMELGQDLMHATAGEAFTPVEREVDLDGADEAFRRAIELARELGDDPTLAAALREAGVVQLGRVRAWFVEQMQLGAHIAIGQRVAAGEVLEEMLPEFPIAPVVYEASALFEEALELFERLGDRRGVMASIIAMGYLNWAPDIHLGSGAARHIEEIRRLTSKAKAFTNESERAAFEAQMLYGVHVFARAKVIPDLALSRGEQAHAHAREIGRSLARVPGGRRNGDGAPRHGRGGTGEIVAGPSGGDRLGASDPSPRASPGDVARARAVDRRRRGRDAAAPGAGGAARLRIGAGGRQVRGLGASGSGSVAPRGRARGRRSARARRALGRRSCGTRRRAPGPSAVGSGGGTPPSLGSSFHEAGPRKPRITRARRWRRWSRGCTRTGTWTSCCRSRTP